MSAPSEQPRGAQKKRSKSTAAEEKQRKLAKKQKAPEAKKEAPSRKLHDIYGHPTGLGGHEVFDDEYYEESDYGSESATDYGFEHHAGHPATLPMHLSEAPAHARDAEFSDDSEEDYGDYYSESASSSAGSSSSYSADGLYEDGIDSDALVEDDLSENARHYPAHRRSRRHNRPRRSIHPAVLSI